MIEKHARVSYISLPKLVVKDDNGREYKIQYRVSNFPDEINRIGGHTCKIKPGSSVWLKISNTVIQDIYFPDIPDFDFNVTEESVIVRLLTERDGFAQRTSCPSCNIHICRQAFYQGDYFEPLEIGMNLRHKVSIFNGKVTASEIIII